MALLCLHNIPDCLMALLYVFEVLRFFTFLQTLVGHFLCFCLHFDFSTSDCVFQWFLLCLALFFFNYLPLISFSGSFNVFELHVQNFIAFHRLSFHSFIFPLSIPLFQFFLSIHSSSNHFLTSPPPPQTFSRKVRSSQRQGHTPFPPPHKEIHSEVSRKNSRHAFHLSGLRLISC